jgi:hypothetical protein
MAKVGDIYSSVYVNVEQWPIKAETRKIVDAGVDDDPFNKKEGSQLIWLQFEEDGPRYRCNRLNAGELSKAWGDETDDWIGKQVTICRVQGKVKGKNEWLSQIKPAKGKGGKSPQ